MRHFSDYTQEEKQEMVELFKQNGYNAAAASRCTNKYSHDHILIAVKEAGYIPKHGGRRVALKRNGKGACSDEEIKRIIELFRKYNGNLGRISKATHRSEPTVYKYLIRHGLQPDRKPRVVYKSGEEHGLDPVDIHWFRRDSPYR